MPALVVVGVSHHAAPLELRERLAFDFATWRCAAPDNLPTVLLSTCNRVEVYAWAEARPAATIARLERSLARAAGLTLADVRPHLFSARGRDAVLHLVRVAAGLDSLIVGEDQIRGQVRDALRQAERAWPLPAQLHGVFQRVSESARRVRGGTQLRHLPSIAAAAVHVAERVLPDGLAHKHAVVLGAGVVARAATESLLARGARVHVLNRTPEHAERMVAHLGQRVTVSDLAALATALEQADLVIGATASRQPIVDVETLRAAVQRRDKCPPVVVLDIAVPRDIDACARSVEGIHLIDLDDLERSCPVDLVERHAELERAEALARAEADRLAHWLRLRAAGPVISELRGYAETIRAAELRRSAARLKDLTPEQVAAVEALTAGIVNKLLHGPTVALRDAAKHPNALSRSRRRILRVLRPGRGRTA